MQGTLTLRFQTPKINRPLPERVELSARVWKLEESCCDRIIH